MIGAAAAFIARGAQFAAAQAPNEPADAQIGSQGGAPSPHGSAPQGGDDTTLEIAPQPGAVPRKPAVQEVPSNRTFQPGENNASIEPSFRPKTENDTGNNDDNARSHRRPYLGITVQYTTQCYLGMEEHGLEVMTIDPNSPAQRSGLQARSGPTALGAAGVTAGTMLGPLSMLVNPLLSRAGSLGQGGDLIVAVDDRRVRNQGDLDDAMARIKPGDTMYLTIIRPIPGGGHKTMKVAVRVGAVGEPIANSAPAGAPPPPNGESPAR